MATTAVKIATQGNNDLHQPLGQGALPAHSQACACCYGRTPGGSERRNHIPQHRWCNARHCLRALGGPGTGYAVQLVDTLIQLGIQYLRRPPDFEQFMQEAQQEINVGARCDGLILTGHFGGFGLPGIHHQDAATALENFLEPAHRMGHLQKRPLGHHRVGAQNQQELEVVQIGKGLGKREAVNGLGGSKAVGAILGRRAVDIA